MRHTATEYGLPHALSLGRAPGDHAGRPGAPRIGGRGNPQAVRKLRNRLGDDARIPKYTMGERRTGYRMPTPGD